ncbi:unnamed protein product [Periconia digitata]|uniref:Uncharacterized protein n=1 Tax=Periconia digitata TaxID=1303443 RepID=A0A9W4UE85_9PLEO|nr:unnamed protein product [Periconia digitata]
MATPQDLTTTVSGRRCTRTRVRTAASSTVISSAPPPAPSSTSLLTTSSIETTTSTTSQAVQQIETSASVAQQPPPPPPSPSPASTSSSITTVSTPVQPAQQAPETQAASSTLAVAASSTSSLPGPEPLTTPPAQTVPVQSSVQSSSIPAIPDSTTATPGGESSDPSVPEEPESPQPTDTGISTGGSAGTITPGGRGQGTTPEEQGLTLPSDSQTNVAEIAGGVVGGVVGLALISLLLFLCLRRRKTGRNGKLQQRISEKNGGEESVLAKTAEKFKAIPANIGVVLARIKGKKTGPASNPYRRHSVRSSVSSVYSVQNHGRNMSITDSPSGLQKQLRAFGDRMPSLKRSRTLLHKKQDSLVVGNKSPFLGIVEDPVLRNSKKADEEYDTSTEQPKNLFIVNPDRQTRDEFGKGLQNQQRGPLTPAPAATSERGSKDPFASILDELEERNGSGTPEWLRDNVQKHKRATSTQTALRSHPPSAYTASTYSTAENPFFDPSDAPPVPSQPLPPNPPIRPTNAYAPLPAFNATSSTISRESDMSFMFEDPVPSRPGTNMYGSKVRQSDPFDLDRPEVLSFGTVGGRTIRASTVTRQNSRRRGSSVPNWVNVKDGPYHAQTKP